MAQLKDLYSAHVETLTDRTSLALERTEFDRLVIHAGDMKFTSRFDDLECPFRPTPAFAHWTPWAWPGSALVLEKGRAATLYARRRTDFWDSVEAPDRDLVESALNVEEVGDLSALHQIGMKPRTAFIGESASIALRLGFEDKSVNPHKLIEELDEIRVQKSPYEIEMLWLATLRAVKGHQAAKEVFLGGERSELMIHLSYLSTTEQDDSETPYKNIVALGTAASVLHHRAYGTRPMAKTLLLDAGAKVRGYGSDITRTHVVGSDSSDFGVLLERMDQLQGAVLDKLCVGKNYEELHNETHELLGRLLVDLQFVRCSAEAAVAEGITRVFFPHGLGHSLGVQVHDVGCRRVPPRKDNAWLRNTRTIEPAQVLTIEPGCYFIGALLDPLKASSSAEMVRWDRVDPLRSYGGIRIEDNIVVRQGNSGRPFRNLTREAFSGSSHPLV
ncbi:MAG: Xaa-Pro dipeptidase [Myxococcales bacterium]|nr:Xaa-Pro dipeptidase [Myxococcales bacterium]